MSGRFAVSVALNLDSYWSRCQTLTVTVTKTVIIVSMYWKRIRMSNWWSKCGTSLPNARLWVVDSRISSVHDSHGRRHSRRLQPGHDAPRWRIWRQERGPHDERGLGRHGPQRWRQLVRHGPQHEQWVLIYARRHWSHYGHRPCIQRCVRNRPVQPENTNPSPHRRHVLRVEILHRQCAHPIHHNCNYISDKTIYNQIIIFIRK